MKTAGWQSGHPALILNANNKVSNSRMMKSPWKEIDIRAYAPMFDEYASIKTPDGKTTTFEVAVFTDGIADPLTDDMMDTDREDVTFVFKKKDWPFVKNLTRGTIVTRCTYDKQYAISEAKLDNCFGWCVTAREK